MNMRKLPLGNKAQYASAMLIRVGGAGLMFLMNIVLARTAGAENYGVMAIGLACGLVAMNLGSLGFSMSSIRFVAAYLQAEKYAQIKSFLGTAMAVTACGAALAGLIALGIAIIGKHAGLLQENAARAFLLALPLILIFPFVDLVGGIQRGYESIVRALAPYNLAFPVSVMAGAGLLWWFDPAAFDRGAAFWCLYIGAGVTIVLAGGLMLKRWPWEHETAKDAARGEWLRTSFAMIPSLASGFAVRQIDAIVLSFFVSPSQIALYWFAGRITRLASFGLQAAHMVVSPQFARLRAEVDHLGIAEVKADKAHVARMQAAASGAARATAVMALPLVALLFVAGPLLLRMAGEEYAGALTVLYIILLGEVVNVACGLNGAFMNMTGLQNQLAKISSSILVLYVVLVGFGSALYGITGAAIAVSSITIIQNLFMSRAVYRAFGVNTTMFSRHFWRR